VPTTTITPLMPMVPTTAVQIWIPRMENQLGSHSNEIPAAFYPSACPLITIYNQDLPGKSTKFCLRGFALKLSFEHALALRRCVLPAEGRVFSPLERIYSPGNVQQLKKVKPTYKIET